MDIYRLRIATSLHGYPCLDINVGVLTCMDN